MLKQVYIFHVFFCFFVILKQTIIFFSVYYWIAVFLLCQTSVKKNESQTTYLVNHYKQLVDCYCEQLMVGNAACPSFVIPFSSCYQVLLIELKALCEYRYIFQWHV